MTTRRLLTLAVGGLAFFIVAWLIFWSVDFEYEQTETLSPNLQLIERVRAERSPFTWGGHAGPEFVLPIPSREDWVLQQKLMRAEEELWSSTHRDALLGAMSVATDATPEEVERGIFERERELSRRWRVKMYPSPDERFVAFRSERDVTPIRVFDAGARTTVEIPPPDSVRPRSDFGYPVRFHAWSADSRILYLRTHEGTEYVPGRSSYWFREIYRVNPETGNATRAVRCLSDKSLYETKGAFDWSATACSDSARP